MKLSYTPSVLADIRRDHIVALDRAYANVRIAKKFLAQQNGDRATASRRMQRAIESAGMGPSDVRFLAAILLVELARYRDGWAIDEAS